MRNGFYLKLAAGGIRKNYRLYVPFLLTCSGMTIVYYLVSFLSDVPVIAEIRGGDMIQEMLGFGSGVIAVFSVFFLLYSYSFLIRRRKKEFGLYNVLGMGKGAIGRILLWETVLLALISIVSGLAAGILLSKLAELALVNIMRGEVTYSFFVSVMSIRQTVLIFCGIFLLLLLNALRQIRVTSPAALLKSENVGEKPPKANPFLGIAGAVILGIAYYIAVTTENPLAALLLFFVAVVMVIIATYLLFIAGSVFLCRILQKNKRYYYKPNHFVSVSSMVYRMKRNGAGLASICILATMVLVMVSSTSCLYFGEEDSLRSRYPRDITVQTYLSSLEDMRDENIEMLRGETERAFAGSVGENKENVLEYRYAAISGLLKDGVLEADVTALSSFSTDTFSNVVNVYFVPLADYNRMKGTAETLTEREVMIYAFRTKYTAESFTVSSSGKQFRVKKALDSFFENGFSAMDIISTVFVVVPDLESSIAELMTLADYNGNRMVSLHWYYGFDTEVSSEVQAAGVASMRSRLREMEIEKINGLTGSSVENLAAGRDNFYGTFGGLFFLGIMLSIVFLFATVLIIYYKQVSEGYEDRERFGIMQKIGMTEREIRKNIHSQMLTVFLLPFAAAVMHLAFAFPIIKQLLRMFNMTNIHLFVRTSIISTLFFGAVYAMVYHITSNVYYRIVSGKQ